MTADNTLCVFGVRFFAAVLKYSSIVYSIAEGRGGVGGRALSQCYTVLCDDDREAGAS